MYIAKNGTATLSGEGGEYACMNYKNARQVLFTLWLISALLTQTCIVVGCVRELGTPMSVKHSIFIQRILNQG